MFDYFCPVCGEEMKQWQGSIYECNDCGNMIDMDIFEEDKEDSE